MEAGGTWPSAKWGRGDALPTARRVPSRDKWFVNGVSSVIILK